MEEEKIIMCTLIDDITSDIDFLEDNIEALRENMKHLKDKARITLKHDMTNKLTVETLLSKLHEPYDIRFLVVDNTEQHTTIRSNDTNRLFPYLYKREKRHIQCGCAASMIDKLYSPRQLTWPRPIECQ